MSELGKGTPFGLTQLIGLMSCKYRVTMRIIKNVLSSGLTMSPTRMPPWLNILEQGTLEIHNFKEGRLCHKWTSCPYLGPMECQELGTFHIPGIKGTWRTLGERVQHFSSLQEFFNVLHHEFSKIGILHAAFISQMPLNGNLLSHGGTHKIEKG